MEETENSDEKQIDKPWLFKKGQSGNPKGKPKGTFSLKTYAKKYLQEMTDDEKIEFMEGLPKEVIWKMAEGNPENKSDITTGGQPFPLYNPNAISDNESVKEDTQPQETA